MSDDCLFVRGKDHQDQAVTVYLETAQQPQYDWMREHLGIKVQSK
jgi:hypothetical protein